MHAKLIPIGNSRGIRLPKAVIEQYALGDEVELELGVESLSIRPKRVARKGWDEAFLKMRKKADDQLLLPDAGPSEWDRKEWKW